MPAQCTPEGNGICARSADTLRNPWGIVGRVPIPPTKKKCEQPYTYNDVIGSLKGNAKMSAPVELQSSNAQVNLYPPNATPYGMPGGTSGGGGGGGVEDFPDIPAPTINIPSNLVGRRNKMERRTFSIGRSGIDFETKELFNLCKIDRTTNKDSELTLTRPDGTSQTFSGPNAKDEAAAAVPNLASQWEDLADGQIQQVLNNWGQSQDKTVEVFQTNESPIDALAINYNMTDSLSLSIAPIIGEGVSVSATSSTSITATINQNANAGKGGSGRGPRNPSGGSNTSFTAKNVKVKNKQNKKATKGWRAGISLRATYKVGDWTIEGQVDYSRYIENNEVDGFDQWSTDAPVMGFYLCTKLKF